MFHIVDLRSAQPLFKCLSSELRISILELIHKTGPISMTEIASRLCITPGALTPHVKELADCGLLEVSLSAGKRGIQRICSAKECHLMIDPAYAREDADVFESEVNIGHYTGYEVYPTCGLATTEHLIGIQDDPRFFASPERIDAAILWMGHGYVEYMLPNYLQPNLELTELQISLELSSEAPGSSEDWPSDILFSLNGVDLCQWTSPGDFARMRGIYTPAWWDRIWNQHGLFKLLTIDNTGTYIDGRQLTNVTLSKLGITHRSSLILRIGVSKDAKHMGGLTLFGRGFGNYDQGIKLRMHYRKTDEAESTLP